MTAIDVTPLNKDNKISLNKILISKLADLSGDMATALDESDYIMFSLLLDEVNKTNDIYKNLNKKTLYIDKDSQK